MRMAIIGSGKVGFATGKGFSETGNDVIFYDSNAEVLEEIEKKGYKNSQNLEKIVLDSDIFIICLPTPTKRGKINLSIIKKVTKEMSKLLKNREKYFLFVVKSTTVPLTTEKHLIPILEKYSGKKAGKDFGVCYNPEFLREDDAYQDFINPDRIVIGEYDKKSGKILEGLYKTFKKPIIRTDLKTAEIAKYANNCFYATKISFFNEFHMVCKNLGIDSNLVRKIVQMDRYYSNHPWFHGERFGGNCLPKDLNAFVGFCKNKRIHDPVLLKAVWKVNKEIDGFEV